MKSLTGREFARVLESNGWVLHHVKGSHHYYTKPGESVMLSVPIHGGRNLKAGTQRALMKLAALTDADL